MGLFSVLRKNCQNGGALKLAHLQYFSVLYGRFLCNALTDLIFLLHMKRPLGGAVRRRIIFGFT